MRRACTLAAIFLGLSLSRWPARGQDAPATNTAATNTANAAAATAEQQGVDEKFKQFAADIDSLRAANDSLRDKLAGIQEELQKIRLEQARLEGNTVTPDELKTMAANLAGKIEEVDKKRVDDKDLIAEQIKQTAIRLEKLILDTGALPPKTTSASPPPNITKPTGDDYTYKINSGDTLLAIVNSYNAEFKAKGMKLITLKQAEDANPTVNWTHLKVGQQIVIPHPPD